MKHTRLGETIANQPAPGAGLSGGLHVSNSIWLQKCATTWNETNVEVTRPWSAAVFRLQLVKVDKRK
jgi:hypothetical protein